MSTVLSLGDLSNSRDEGRPIRPSVKLAARWSDRERIQMSYNSFGTRTADSEQQAINHQIAETQSNLKYLMEKSTYYTRNAIQMSNDLSKGDELSMILQNYSKQSKTPQKGGTNSSLRSPTFNTTSFN